MKPTTQMNLTGLETQLAGGRPVGYVQAQPRSWTRDYFEQNQLVVRADFKSRFQVRRPNHSATLRPSIITICQGVI